MTKSSTLGSSSWSCIFWGCISKINGLEGVSKSLTVILIIEFIVLTFMEDCIPHSGMPWLVSGASTTGTWTRWTAAGTWFCWTCNSPWNLDTTRKDHYEINDKDEIRCSMVAGQDRFTHVVWSLPLQIRYLTRKVHYFVLLARQTWRTDCWVAVGDNGAYFNFCLSASELPGFKELSCAILWGRMSSTALMLRNRAP